MYYVRIRALRKDAEARCGGARPSKTEDCRLLLVISRDCTVAEKYIRVYRSRFAVIHICASRFTFVLRGSRLAVICASHFTFVLRGSRFLIRGSYFLVRASQFAVRGLQLVLSRSQFTDRPCL